LRRTIGKLLPYIPFYVVVQNLLMRPLRIIALLSELILSFLVGIIIYPNIKDGGFRETCRIKWTYLIALLAFLGRVLINSGSVIDVRFTPDAIKLLRSSEMTRCANSGHWPPSFDHLVGGHEAC
jgi:hypothetical protein